MFPPAAYNAYNSFINAAGREYVRLGVELHYIDLALGVGTGIVAYGMDVALAAVGNTLSSTISKTGRFIKENWKPLLGYLAAWGIIVACMGLMHGFEAVALPITIGLGCGIGAGIVSGILIYRAGDRVGKWALWHWINVFIEKLDTNGTRQIITAVAVSVLLTASAVYPYVMGAIFGILIGNQMTMKVATGRNLGRDPETIAKEKKEIVEELRKLKQEVAQNKKDDSEVVKSLKEMIQYATDKLEEIEQRQGGNADSDLGKIWDLEWTAGDQQWESNRGKKPK